MVLEKEKIFQIMQLSKLIILNKTLMVIVMIHTMMATTTTGSTVVAIVHGCVYRVIYHNKHNNNNIMNTFISMDATPVVWLPSDGYRYRSIRVPIDADVGMQGFIFRGRDEIGISLRLDSAPR